MRRHQSGQNNFILPEDKLPECNLFTLFLRKQIQASSDNLCKRKQSENKEPKKQITKTKKVVAKETKEMSLPKAKEKKEKQNCSITPERSVSKKKQIVYSNMKNLKKTQYHHLSVNVLDSVEAAQSTKTHSKINNSSSYQKSRKPSLTIRDLSTQFSQAAAPFTTQRSQSSQCKTRKSSISADIAHKHSQRNILTRFNNHNTNQNRTILTEQSQERSTSLFKAKKMPNFQIPFVIYKSNKPLTTFTEFQLGNRQRSSSGQNRNNSNTCRSNNASNISHISHKSQNLNVSIYGRDQSESCISVLKQQSSVAKSSNRSYLNENINYQNLQNMPSSQSHYSSQQQQQKIQSSNQQSNFVSQRSHQNSGRMFSSHHSSSQKEQFSQQQFPQQQISQQQQRQSQQNQIPKYSKARQYL